MAPNTSTSLEETVAAGMHLAQGQFFLMIGHLAQKMCAILSENSKSNSDNNDAVGDIYFNDEISGSLEAWKFGVLILLT